MLSKMIVRDETPQFRLFAVREFDGEIMWDARRRYATYFPADEAEAIATELKSHGSIVAVDVVAVRNTVESEPCQ